MLPPDFFARDALEVALDLIGAELLLRPELGGRRVRLAELEAYRFPGDTANHARFGKTTRNAPMWGPPAHVYVYLCYGMHHMLNLVTGPEGHAAAVLVRGVEPLDEPGRLLAGPALDGPGKVARALGLTRAHSGLPNEALFDLVLPDSPPPRLVGARVGIDYAEEADRLAPWRVGLAGSRHVGHRRHMRLHSS